MESKESSFQTRTKIKLPLTVDWWRDVEKNKNKSNYVEIESLESPTPDMMSSESKEIQRDSTIDTSGAIEISSIIFPIVSETEKEIYEKNCERLNCATSRKFGKTVDNISLGSSNDDVNMAHYGLTSIGVRATAISISNLSHCSVVDFEGNKLTAGSLGSLISALKKSTVTEINLSSTNISRFGPRILASWLSSPTRVKKLYIKDNQFDDNDAILLCEAFAGNRSITTLDLSQNHLSLRCGDALKKLLDENDILEEFNLSWNHLRLNAVTSIANGLKKNNGIKKLMLNWNGVEDSGIIQISAALKDNDCLQHLEVAYNRITDSGFKFLMKILDKNLSLKCLKIGGNIISQETASLILQTLKSNEYKDSAIETLDFTNIIFKPNFQNEINSVKESRKGFNCVFGYGDSYGKLQITNYGSNKNALLFFKTYIENHNIHVLKIFEEFLLHGNMNITCEDFQQSLKKAQIPISEEQVSVLIKYLKPNNDGIINIRELVMDAESSDKI